MPFHNNSRGGMKRLNPKNKGKRNTAESYDGSGDTIGKTNPVDKKSFSVKTIDVNQDLMLSDEDEDSEDDQKFSPTKSFKVKLVSKELWHFGGIEWLFRQIKGFTITDLCHEFTI